MTYPGMWYNVVTYRVVTLLISLKSSKKIILKNFLLLDQFNYQAIYASLFA